MPGLAVIALLACGDASSGPNSIDDGPLRVGSSPYFFTDGTGKAVFLTGAHTWLNFQDAGFTDPPLAFNWPAYLDFLEQYSHNFIRLWRWEQAKWSAETTDDLWFAPMPYLRPGPGVARDGKPKFNLSQFNPAYFARMRQRVLDAGQRGLYISVMLFNGWSIEDKDRSGNPWLGHPFHRDNNINGIDGDPNGTGEGLTTHTLNVGALVALQEAYARQVVDAVNDLDNVLYEISNESRPGTGAEAWQAHMVAYVKQYEAGKPKQHPVGMTALYPDGDNADLDASGADWISPKDSPFNPTRSDGRKVILNDTDHNCGICFTEPWVWESLMQGLNVLLMDPYDGAFPVTAAYDPNDPSREAMRRSMGYARSYAMRVNLAAMRPHPELTTSDYCLANPVAQGGEYLVYLPAGGSVTVNLSATPGPLTVEWFDPSTGLASPGSLVTGGASLALTAPTSGDAVLYLHN